MQTAGKCSDQMGEALHGCLPSGPSKSLQPHPPASWVTLAKDSDFVLSFPWVWNWKRAPRLPYSPATSPSVSLYGYENE